MNENFDVPAQDVGQEPGNEYPGATPLTFDDLLKDPEYQREFDKKVSKALEKSKTKWQEEADAKRSEAEELARMSEEEKHQHQLEKILKEKEDAVGKLNAYELKDTAQRIAASKGIDISLLNLIDYKNETADSIKNKIDDIEVSFNKAVEKRVNEKLRQFAPTHKTENHKSAEQEYLDSKYGNSPYYNK